jgi:polyhydroxyalkanoate synthesis regulator phasin
MAGFGFGDIVQKAVYLGIGLATYAGEKAGSKITELRAQVQKLADEMVERGEMTAEEGRRFVDEMVSRAQQPSPDGPEPSPPPPSEPRRIEILSEDEEPSTPQTPTAEDLRKQVQNLQDELRRLKRD